MCGRVGCITGSGVNPVFVAGRDVNPALVAGRGVFQGGMLSLCVAGWGGKGLGSSEQGRVEPVEQAEVRDRSNMYKGVGVAVNDPFEQFRKSKAKGFVKRMSQL